MWAALVLPLLVGACGDEDPLGPEEVEYHASLGVNLANMTRLPSGVYVQTVQPGPGSRSLQLGDSIHLAYTLWLPSGTKLQEGDFEIRVQGQNLIRGFRDGIIGMVKGEARLIVVPPDQGYGSSPPSGIPPDAVLVFRAELLDYPEDDDEIPPGS